MDRRIENGSPWIGVVDNPPPPTTKRSGSWMAVDETPPPLLLPKSTHLFGFGRQLLIR